MEGPEREHCSEPPKETREKRADSDKSHGGNVGFSRMRNPILQEIIATCPKVADNTDIVPDKEICPKRCENSRRLLRTSAL